MKYDGSITIGTQVDDKGLEDGIKELETKVEQTEANIDVDVNENESMDKIKKFLEATKQLVAENEMTLNASFNNSQATQEALKLLTEMQNVVDEINNEMKINPDFDESDLLKYLVKINELSNKLEALKKEPVKINFGDIETKLDNIGKKMDNNIKKVVRWGLSLFSLGTIFGMVSRIASTAMSQNEAMANTMANVWSYLGELIMPIMEGIVQWVLKALAVVNYFLQALTGINFAARTNERIMERQAKATNKQTQATKKQTQAQKELNKELTKFDEITKVTDETNVGNNLDTGINVGGVDTGLLELPELDENTKRIIDNIVAKLKEVWDNLKPIRKIIKDIIDWGLQHPDAVLAILGGVGLVGTLAKILGVGGLGGTGLLGIYAVLLYIAAVKAFEHIGYEINDLNSMIDSNIRQWKFLGDQWKIFDEIVNGGKANLENFDEALKINTKNLGNSTLALADNIAQTDFLKIRFDILAGTYDKNLKSLMENIDALTDEKNSMFNLYNQTEKNEEQTKRMREYLEKYKNTLEKTNDKLGSNTDLAIANSKEISKNKEKIKEADLQLKYLDATLKGDTRSFEQFAKETQNANDKIKNVNKDISNLDGKKATVKVDADTSQAENKTKNWFSNLGNAMSSALSVFGINFKFPKLASGGIINMPSRGIPIGNAIAGERGAEGVIPLTDSQQMELLGEAIGKYITVNNVLNNYMNGRLISRELQKSDNESNFAFNK